MRKDGLRVDPSCPCVTVCLSVIVNIREVSDFHEVWYERHGTTHLLFSVVSAPITNTMFMRSSEVGVTLASLIAGLLSTVWHHTTLLLICCFVHGGPFKTQFVTSIRERIHVKSGETSGNMELLQPYAGCYG